MNQTGILYIIPTPIGNLEDITLRAKRLLGELSVLACEDTRTTKKLLDLIGVDPTGKRFFAYHEYNEVISADGIIKTLLSGVDVGLVSDAGTPLISDPGYKVVNQCREKSIEIVTLPGPSSLISALAGSGLPTNSFKFYGFVPQKKGRQTFISLLKDINETAVFFESTHRIVKLLNSLLENGMGYRQICIAKEISKLNEQYIYGSVTEVIKEFEVNPKLSKGEFVVVLSSR